MIINSSYFQSKETYIPNVVAQPSIGSNTPTAASQLQMEIDGREYELLVSFLGSEQTDELLAQFETNGDWKPTALQKWKNLVDGVTYASGTKKWNGLRYTIGTKKISLIADYVFFHYLGADYKTYNTPGIQIAKSENAINQTPNASQAKAWNRFAMRYGYNNIGHVDYGFFRNWNGQGLRWGALNSNEITLYRFMTDNSDDYDTSFFTPQGLISDTNL